MATIRCLLRTHRLDTSIPHLQHIMCTLLVLPVSTVDCERGFSAMKIIKTRLRNRLSEKNMQHAMMIAIEGPTIDRFNFEAALNKFKSKKKRRVI